jgi:hypothetical protein
MARPTEKEYAVYKGDDLLCMGTAKDCSEYLGVQEKTVRFYLTPSYKNRVARRKKARNFITVIKLDEEGE